MLFQNIDNIIFVFVHVFNFPLLILLSSLINHEKIELSFPIISPLVLTSVIVRVIIVTH